MKKKLLGLLLAAVLVLSMVCTVFADSVNGGDYYVNYTGATTLESDFSSEAVYQAASEMQPGDSLTVTFTVKNTKDKDQAVNYYMSNRMVKSFEEVAGKAGAAYTYRLIYTNPTDTTAGKSFFDNTSVGGTDSSGLTEIKLSDSDGDYFFLDELSYGEEGIVTLYVELDGETQGNEYFNSLAELNVAFQVEEIESKPDDKVIEETTVGETKVVRTTRNTVTTGDRTNLLPLWICFGVAGIVLVVFAIILLKRRKQEQE